MQCYFSGYQSGFQMAKDPRVIYMYNVYEHTKTTYFFLHKPDVDYSVPDSSRTVLIGESNFVTNFNSIKYKTYIRPFLLCSHCKGCTHTY